VTKAPAYARLPPPAKAPGINRGLSLNRKGTVMTKVIFVGSVILLILSAGCANMTPTQQRVLSGGAIGAGGGAVIGALAGSAGLGAAAGAGAGLLGGLLYDQTQKSQ